MKDLNLFFSDLSEPEIFADCEWVWDPLKTLGPRLEQLISKKVSGGSFASHLHGVKTTLDSPNYHRGGKGLYVQDWIDLADERGIKYFSMNEVLNRGVDEVTREAAKRVWGGTDSQYLSIDMNVMDASAAPGVTSPEPGGLEAREIMMINEILGENGSIGMIDLTELCPVVDVNAITTKLAACALLRFIAVIASVNGEKVDQSIKREDLK